MSQVSYGTITITDTTDIEQIYMVYAGSESNITPPDVDNFTLWKTDIIQTSGTYIWQRAVVKKSGIEITATNFQQFYGEPVCITGEGGRSIKSIISYYCNYGTGTPDESYSGWKIDTPEYDEDKPNYWVKTVIIYVDDSETGFESSGSIVTIEDGEHKQVTSLKVALEPIQDLNGYDKPWVGGAGKNKLDTSGMSTAGQNGVTFSRASDGTITVGGRANTTVYRTIGSIQTENGVQYTITGTSSGSANGKYRMTVVGYGYDYGSGYTFTGDGNSHDISVDIYTGYPSSGTLTFKPMIRLASVSDATYEPYENICPISGHDSVDTYVSGNNLITSENTEDGAINASGVESVNANFTRTKLIPVADTIAVNFAVATGYVIRLHGYDSSGTWVRQIKDYSNVEADHDVVTIPSGISYVKLSFPKVATDVSIENVPTYTTALGCTVYGGTLDVVSGVLTVDRAMVDLGTLNWIRTTNSHKTYFQTTAEVSDMKKSTGNTAIQPILCSNYETESWTKVLDTDAYDGVVCEGWANKSYIVIADSTKASLDANSFKTAMSGVQLCYELATPQTYQLTPQQVELLVGENHLWSDERDVEVSGFTIVDKDIQIRLDNGLTNAMAKAADAQSRATTAETNAASALSLSQATQQHFWFNSVKTGNIEAGAYITDVVIDSFKPNKSGNYLLAGSNGIELGNGSHPYMQLTASELNFFHPNSSNIDAQLSSNGLVVKSGGIEAGTVGQDGGIYLSTKNYGTTHNNQTITINGYEATNWRQIIGTKFGVDSEGNLYANGAKIAGDITVSKLTVNSGATISDENGLISNSAIEVGGRNLLKLSDSLSTDNCWTVESGTIEDGIAKLNDVNNARIYQLPANGYWTWTANTVYTVSVEARTSATGAIHITPVDCGGIASETFTLSTEWKRYSYTFSSATVGTGSLSIYRNAGSVELRKPKLEIGNKATDWTPAPEDVNTNIALTAEGLDNGIGSLSERISGVELQQNSFEDEVDNKFTNIRGLQTAFEEDTLESLKNLKDAQSTFASISELSQLQKFINEYIGTDGYITSGGDAGNPYLEIGKKIGTTSFYVQISSTEMGFYQNGVKVAYINSSQLYITNSEVLNEQRIGAFNWKVEGSNRMSLVYSPK